MTRVKTKKRLLLNLVKTVLPVIIAIVVDYIESYDVDRQKDIIYGNQEDDDYSLIRATDDETYNN